MLICKKHDTCDGCAALQNDACVLGYGTEPAFYRYCFRVSGRVPLVPCPKPRCPWELKDLLEAGTSRGY